MIICNKYCRHFIRRPSPTVAGEFSPPTLSGLAKNSIFTQSQDMQAVSSIGGVNDSRV